MTPVRVIIADDQLDVREALNDLLATDPGIEVVGMASTTDEAVWESATLRPDVVLMDVKMPGGGGALATRLIRTGHPEIRVLALSAYQDRLTVLEMLTAGAIGYVTKGSPPTEILGALHRAAEGQGMLSPGASAEVVQELGLRLRAEELQQIAREEQGARIRAALAGGMVMVFQPIVDLRTGRTVGVEALARFDGVPSRPPDVWFAEASDVGMRLPLERAAFEAALDALPLIPEGLFLSVNLSPQTVVETGFWDNLAPDVTPRLVLEITEHAVVNDYERLRRILAPLREQGLRLAVDDAGAGFASLRHILLLDAEFIKVDASLTHDLHRHKARRAMAAALISFATETDATVIAEGIEQIAELDALTRLGAALGQGYLLSRPAALQDLDLANDNDLLPRAQG
jgi:EAL domain-containing protein (putative c-di-GMP-specific phosphodiesterase class I)